MAEDGILLVGGEGGVQGGNLSLDCRPVDQLPEQRVLGRVSERSRNLH